MSEIDLVMASMRAEFATIMNWSRSITDERERRRTMEALVDVFALVEKHGLDADVWLDTRAAGSGEVKVAVTVDEKYVHLKVTAYPRSSWDLSMEFDRLALRFLIAAIRNELGLA